MCGVLGYVGLIEPPFSDQGLRLTNLYWRQRFNGGRFTLLGGFVDPTDYLDVYAMASPWTGFLNFAFSTGTTTMALPKEGFGLAAGAMLTVPQSGSSASAHASRSERPPDPCYPSN